MLSMSAVLLLPRQFQVAVVENVDEDHLRKAMWLFPLYLLIINIFVLPIAFGGLLKLGGQGFDADTFVLALPLATGHSWLALLTYLGGLSAASSMIIVETIALSVMMSNHLLMPLLVRLPAARPAGQQRWFAYLGRVALQSRRLAVLLVVALAYGYYAGVGRQLPLVNTGLVSFAAVAQFLPAVLGALYWKGGTRRGATAGPTGGVWRPGFLRWCCLPWWGRAGCPSPSWSEGVGGWPGCGRARCWAWTASTTSRTACFGAGFSTLAATWACRWPCRLPPRTASGRCIRGCARRRSLAEEVTGWQGRTSLPDVRALLLGFLGKKRTTQALRAFAERFPDALPPTPLTPASLGARQPATSNQQPGTENQHPRARRPAPARLRRKAAGRHPGPGLGAATAGFGGGGRRNQLRQRGGHSQRKPAATGGQPPAAKAEPPIAAPHRGAARSLRAAANP
ncbi:MAG: hypothetical protein WKG07_17000 [Hymenobacter sp.]